MLRLRALSAPGSQTPDPCQFSLFFSVMCIIVGLGQQAASHLNYFHHHLSILAVRGHWDPGCQGAFSALCRGAIRVCDTGQSAGTAFFQGSTTTGRDA